MDFKQNQKINQVTEKTFKLLYEEAAYDFLFEITTICTTP